MTFLLRAAMMVMIIACFGCNARIERSPDELVMVLKADPTTLNPILATDSYSGSVTGSVYEQLVEMDKETLEWKPRLAERWEVSADGRVFTFYLRRDVTWQDGKPFTADDVIYTFDRIMDPKVDAASARSYYREVERAEKLDAHTVRFTYARPYFKAFEMVGLLTVLPKHIFDDGQDFNTHSANRAPLGTGPYRFVEWKLGRSIRLVRNERYWRKPPDITGLVFRVIPDSTASFQLLKKGAVDVDELRAVQWARQTDSSAFNEKFSKYKYYLPNFGYIGWNMRRPFFSDARVRRAMAMCIDRKELLNKLLFGLGEVVDGPFYRFGADYDPDLPTIPYDPEGAKKLLDEAGWIDRDGDGIRDKDGVAFRFSLVFPTGSPFARSVGLFLRNNLERLGIDMQIQQMEWAALIRQLDARNFDAVALRWSLPLHQDPYQVWHSSQIATGSNIVGFSNAEADRLIVEARREFDAEKRAKLYWRLSQIIAAEQPYAFLFTHPTLVALSRRFGNVIEYRIGLDSEEWTVEDRSTLMAW